VEQQLHEATVTVGGRCAGVIVAGGRQLLTAAHCLRPRERLLRVTFINGEEQVTRLASIDRRRDLAVLILSRPAPFDGLEITEALPLPGTAAYFAGRHDRGGRLQPIHIVQVGRCPSLPHVPAALFTSLRGRPGDSGAPVVDAASMKVVGLVHGGAGCSVAAPAFPARIMLQLADEGSVAARAPTASATQARR